MSNTEPYTSPDAIDDTNKNEEVLPDFLNNTTNSVLFIQRNNNENNENNELMRHMSLNPPFEIELCHGTTSACCQLTSHGNNNELQQQEQALNFDKVIYSSAMYKEEPLLSGAVLSANSSDTTSSINDTASHHGETNEGTKETTEIAPRISLTRKKRRKQVSQEKMEASSNAIFPLVSSRRKITNRRNKNLSANICEICKRDNVSFAKGYALTAENFSKYNVVFPDLVFNAEKGKICATCYNKCYTYHKRTGRENLENEILSKIQETPSRRKKEFNMHIETTNLSPSSNSDDSGNSNSLASSPNSSIPHFKPQYSKEKSPEKKCLRCGKAKTQQSKLVWLVCAKCQRLCHRKCYTSNKRLKKSLFYQWTCPDCKVCSKCGKTREQAGSTGFNCCKICDNSYCSTCMEGTVDANIQWCCHPCANESDSNTTSNNSTPMSSPYPEAASPLKRNRSCEMDSLVFEEYSISPKVSKANNTAMPISSASFGNSVGYYNQTTSNLNGTSSNTTNKIEPSGYGLMAALDQPLLTYTNGNELLITLLIKYIYEKPNPEYKNVIDADPLDSDFDILIGEQDLESGRNQPEFIEERLYSTFFVLPYSLACNYFYVLQSILNIFNTQEVGKRYAPLVFKKLMLREVDSFGRPCRIELNERMATTRGNLFVDRDVIYCILSPEIVSEDSDVNIEIDMAGFQLTGTIQENK